MNKVTYGEGQNSYIFGPVTVADVAAHVSTVFSLADLDNLSLILLAAGGAATLDGAWKFEVSNDYVPAASGGAVSGQAQNAAPTWVDVTASAMWVDAIVAVAHGTAASTKQAIQPKYPIGFRHGRVTFTGTTGSATVAAILFAKSWS